MQFSRIIGIYAVLLLWVVYVDCQGEITYRVPVYVENARDRQIRRYVYVILFGVIAGNAILGTRSDTGQPFDVVHNGGADNGNGPVPTTK